MLKFRFTFLVFQDGNLTEETSVEQVFNNVQEMATILAKFAAIQSSVRNHPSVIPIYNGKMLEMPPVTDGFGPGTVLVIKEVMPISCE